jgi:hypothetical protein
MKNKENSEALERTLNSAGIENFSVDKLNLLEFSEAIPDLNQKVYKATNNLIFEELSQSRGDLGLCIHVTGEMRALTDPFHRQLCEEMQRREKGRFQILFYAPSNLSNPEENHSNSGALVDWSLQQWFSEKETHWTEKMRTINAIANQSVDILAYDTQDNIQYSVFGNRYVLLQEKHAAHAESKRVWLIESENVNEQLSEKAKYFINNSVYIDETIFRDFSRSLTELSAYRILSKLKSSQIKEDEFLNDKLIKDFSMDPLRSLNALKIMKFIEKDENNVLTITTEGIDFSNF